MQTLGKTLNGLKNEPRPTRAVTAPASQTLIANGILTPYGMAVLLRFSLALVFFWFGGLKLANACPVLDFLRDTFPFFARTAGLQLLGAAEMIIGLGLIFDRFSKAATALMVADLIGTLSVVFIAPHLIFAPAFPVVTMAGEFVAKNLVLIVAGLVVLGCRSK